MCGGQGEAQGCTHCGQHSCRELIPWPGNLPLCPHGLGRAKAGEWTPPRHLWRNLPQQTSLRGSQNLQANQALPSTHTSSLGRSHPVSPQPSRGDRAGCLPSISLLMACFEYSLSWTGRGYWSHGAGKRNRDPKPVATLCQVSEAAAEGACREKRVGLHAQELPHCTFPCL